MADEIVRRPGGDGIDRRGFLKCMAWAGTGLVWTLSSGVLRADPLSHLGHGAAPKGEFHFAQISDSHIGFNKPANTDVTSTFREAIARLDALAPAPDFVIHTGDISHRSKPEEFDTCDQILKGSRVKQVFYVPGEHDVLSDDGAQYRARYGTGSQGAGWYSFDHKGAHFVGLVNVVNLKAGGLGNLGSEQLTWLEMDLKGRPASTPVVVFAHIPLWSVYPDWGWGTDDSAQALSYLKRFGSVTVLNGHIHQVLRKVEGNVAFHTAMSTAFPQPAPGSAPSPGPMTVPAGRLRDLLGVTTVGFVPTAHSLAVVDTPLSAAGTGAAPDQVAVDNFSFAPAALTVKPGAQVTWTNRDDVPHTVVAVDRRFASPVLDTGERFTFQFREPGTYPYYCSVHPKMTGKIVVAP
jgi:3',5'-cyclic-AMP phosphodiesterase